MKNLLTITILCLLSACIVATIDTTPINQQFKEKSFYICDIDKADGKVTFDSIVCNQGYRRCLITLINNSGTTEQFTFKFTTSNYVQELNEAFKQKPFCSASEYFTFQKTNKNTLTSAEKAKTRAEQIEKDKNIIDTLEIFTSFFTYKYIELFQIFQITNFNTYEYEKNLIKFNIYKQFVPASVDLKCFVSEINPDYYHSDECILVRRNTPESTVGYFDYKKFLPQNSVINTDDKFNLLAERYRKLFKADKNQTYCQSLKETTSSEKLQCEKHANRYIEQLVYGTVPLCRNSTPTEYAKFLEIWARNIAEAKKTSANEFDFRFYPIICTTICGGSGLVNIDEVIEDFGIHHFCATDNIKEDLYKMKKYR